MRALKQLTLSQKGVILLSILTLTLGVANLGRAVMAVRYSIRLPDVPTTISLDYLAAMGGIWGIVFIVCTIGLSRFQNWGRRFTLAAVTLYQVNAWVNRLLFSASDYADQTIPRDIVLAGAFLLVFWIPFNLPRVKQTFNGTEEQQFAR